VTSAGDGLHLPAGTAPKGGARAGTPGTADQWARAMLGGERRGGRAASGHFAVREFRSGRKDRRPGLGTEEVFEAGVCV